MIIWGALIIPVICVLVKLLYFKERTLWWEFLVPVGTSLVLISVAKYSAVSLQTDDIEFWGGWGVRAEYYEDWNERVSCTHTKYCKSRDSKGRVTEYACGTKHAYDVDYHPAHWNLVDSNGSEHSLSRGEFESFAKRWKSRRFVDLHRNYHTNDGDKYVADWPGDDFTLEPVTTAMPYENRVQASPSLFNFEPVDEATKRRLGLFDYPAVVGYNQQNILGPALPAKPEAERRLQLINAKLGRSKQVRMFVLLFRNQPLEASMRQQALWVGGNKNEFVLTVGLDNNNRATWARAFSWSDEERLKVDAREFIGESFIDKGRELNLLEVVDWMGQEVGTRFKRKHFREFNYLEVEPSTTAVIITFLLTLLTNVALSYWIVNNEHREPTYRWRR